MPAPPPTPRLHALDRMAVLDHVAPGAVRNVKSFDLLVVEHALKAVLRPDEAPFWLYHAARDYTGKTDVLVPNSAPLVGEIAGFWRKYHGIKR